jgi:hypothetical protein
MMPLTPVSRSYADVNAVVGGYLRDLALAQSSPQKMFGYKRAAAAIFALDAPLTDRIVNCWPLDRRLGWLANPSSERPQ